MENKSDYCKLKEKYEKIINENSFLKQELEYYKEENDKLKREMLEWKLLAITKIERVNKCKKS